MLESMWAGLEFLLSWKICGLIFLATLLGNFFGAVPGLGGNIGLALLIPFIFGMDLFPGVAFLLAMHSVVHTGGSIPGILFGIPGTGPTVATIIDGYPMTKQGRAGEAMGAQLAASAFGGVLGAAVLALLIPLLKPIVVLFGPAEIFMLIVFGMTFIVVISRESPAKGFTAAVLGLLLGTVGLNPHTGVGRFTFDQLWLWDGISIVTIVLGVFAFAEMIDLGARGRLAKIAEGDVRMTWRQLWDGTKAVFCPNWWLSVRTAVIGTFVGVIPGLGGETSTWVCYGHAVQTCRDNENFGKGDIRGVIGVETANNAKEGGSLLPTLVFGVPGSSGMAILMGAFLILGITPGPRMITDHLDLVWGMVWVLVVANIVGAVSLYPLCRYMGNLVHLRASLLIPPITVLAGIGAYLIRGFWQDVVLAIGFGLVGFAMKKWKFPRAPLILGFVLGPLGEDYLHKSVELWGLAFLKKPFVLGLLGLVVASLAYTGWQMLKQRVHSPTGSRRRSGGEIACTVVSLLVFAGALFSCWQWSAAARRFPQILALIGLGLTTWLIVSAVISLRTPPGSESSVFAKKDLKAEIEDAMSKPTPRGEVVMVGWIVLFLGLIYVFGFWVAMAGFTALFTWVYGREEWKVVLSATAGLSVSMYLVFHVLMRATLHGGLFGFGW